MLQIVFLPQTWPKKFKSVLRFEISWWEEHQKVDQTHNGHEMLKYILHLDIWNEKSSLDDSFFLISHPVTLQILLLPQSWPKESKSVLRFEISWWEGGLKVDQTHIPKWKAS